MGFDGRASEALRLEILELFAEVGQQADPVETRADYRLGFNEYRERKYPSRRIRNRHKKRRHREDGRENLARWLGISTEDVCRLRPEDWT